MQEPRKALERKTMGTNSIKQTSPSRGGGWSVLLLVSKHCFLEERWQDHAGTYDCDVVTPRDCGVRVGV